VFGCITFIKIKRESKLVFISTKLYFLDTLPLQRDINAMILLKKVLFQDILAFFRMNHILKKKTQESYTISPSDMVLPQPPELGVLRNIGNYENLEYGAHEDEDQGQNEEEGPIDVRRSTRTSRPPTKLRDYITYSVTYPIENFISYDNISSQHKHT
jgi:hypothetical protein